MNSIRTTQLVCLNSNLGLTPKTGIYILGPCCPSGVPCRDKVHKAQLLPRAWQAGGETKVQATVTLAAGGEVPVVRHCGDGGGGTLVRAHHKNQGTVSERGL